MASTATTSPLGALPMKASSTASHEVPVDATGRAPLLRPRGDTGDPSSRRKATSAEARLLSNRHGDSARRNERCALDGAGSVGVRDRAGPADVPRIRVNAVKLSDAVRPAGYDERGVVREGGRRAKAEPVAKPPHHGAGHHVERGERAVAACEVTSLPARFIRGAPRAVRGFSPTTSASAAPRCRDRSRRGDVLLP